MLRFVNVSLIPLFLVYSLSHNILFLSCLSACHKPLLFSLPLFLGAVKYPNPPPR